MKQKQEPAIKEKKGWKKALASLTAGTIVTGFQILETLLKTIFRILVSMVKV